MDNFEMTTGYFGPRVRGKLAGQRKARDWSIQPVDDGSIIRIRGWAGASVATATGYRTCRRWPSVRACAGRAAERHVRKLTCACKCA